MSKARRGAGCREAQRSASCRPVREARARFKFRGERAVVGEHNLRAAGAGQRAHASVGRFVPFQ